MLRKPDSCQIIQLARDDTSSLLWLRDDESNDTRDRRSILTENSDLLDAAFVFDREVLASKAYLAAIRSNMKRVVREGHSTGRGKDFNRHGNEQTHHDDEDTHTITVNDENQPYDLRRNMSIDSAPSALEHNSATVSGSIISRQGTDALTTLRNGKNPPDQAVRRLMHIPNFSKSRTSISSGTSSKSDGYSRTPSLKAKKEEKLLLIGNAKNSASAILTSMILAYGDQSLLTDQDSCSASREGIKELSISRSSAGVQYCYRVFDVVGLHSEDDKWIYSFEEMSTMIYVADISAYDMGRADDGSTIGIQRDLSLFRQICSTRWLADTPMLLLLTNLDLMTSRLQESPLQIYFEDYRGKATDVAAIKSFFRQRFLSLNTKYEMRIRVEFTESVATAKLGKSVVANVDRILTERSVLTFGTQ